MSFLHNLIMKWPQIFMIINLIYPVLKRFKSDEYNTEDRVLTIFAFVFMWFVLKEGGFW